MEYSNRLINETSPYLLQHAHNPVDWFPWGEEALQKAKNENKLLLISVGYSACHWCHVMEHESFEDEKVAKIMNDFFVCIKVDREERPDVDQVYMTAVQLMTGHGGWPLNCFALPDGKPVYGGTYFHKERWVEILFTLADLWKTEPGKCRQYADELTNGVKQAEELIAESEPKEISEKNIGLSVEQWSMRFDNAEGGPSRAPKFPLPNNYLFLLRYAHLSKKENLLKHVCLTLDKMAMGGIYDQVGGGFARYSTDMLWKVPHFEKMLYDNAQLVSLYAEAYQLTRKQLYRDVVYETLNFVLREMTAVNGAFYSALDADSEGKEGKYYVWTEKELKEISGENFSLVEDYYTISSTGKWEDDQYILLRRKSDEDVAKKNKLSLELFRSKIDAIKKSLLITRDRRVRPGLDDKTLTSWNAMMLKGYADAYAVFGEKEFLVAALKNARFLRDVQLRPDGGLWHAWKNGKSTVNGFLEDYAFAIEAFLALYQCTFDEEWLLLSQKLAEFVLLHFQDPSSPMFYFTSDQDAELVARKKEISDNVIPASNSAMAKNLFYLGHYFGKAEWINRAEKMLSRVQKEMIGYGAGYSNWMLLQLHVVFPFREVVIVGNAVEKTTDIFREHYLPNQIFAGSPGRSLLPLIHNRYVENKTLIYVCENNTCKLPDETAQAAIEKLK